MSSRLARHTAGMAICLATVASAQTPAPAAPSLTLEEAVRLAREHHPSGASARATERAAAARVPGPFLFAVPNVSGAAGFFPQTSNFAAGPQISKVLASQSSLATLGITCDPRQPGCTDPQPCVVTAGGTCVPASSGFSVASPSAQLGPYWSGWLTLSWPLFDFWRGEATLRSLQETHRATEHGAKAADLQVALDAKVAFYRQLAAEQVAAVVREAVATQTRRRALIQASRTAGTRTAVDVAQAEADLATAELRLEEALGQVEVARAQLSSALGLDEWRPFTLVAPDDAAASVDALAASGAAAERQALERRPEPRRFAAAALAQRSQARALRAATWPNLSFQVTPSAAGPSLTTLTPNLQLGVVLGYQGIANPYVLAQQAGEADAAAASLEAQVRSAEAALRLEVAEAVAGVRTALKGLTVVERLLAAARERRTLAEGRFKAGTATVDELNNAESSYIQAQAEQIKTRLDLGLARARLERALGLP